MSKRLGLGVVAVSFLFSQAPGVAGGSNTSAVRNLATSSSGHDDISATIAKVSGQAPIGHRQPRPSDVPETAQSSSSDSELRRLDQEIDRKLIICRGC